MLAAVNRTIAARFPELETRPVLVAASGGADSTALALLLHERGHELTLAHVHHGIRGKTADGDARFTEKLAKQLGARFVLGRFDVPAEARAMGESLEMAARRVRRDFLVATARELGIGWIVVGHTADDQAETVLMRIIRGTSVAGLGGIPYVTEHGGVRFVRPLRELSRCDLLAWLRERGQTWREDESNVDDFALRNRVRNEILPLIESRLNPGARQALLRLGDIAAAENEVMEALARMWSGRDDVAEAPPAILRRLAHDALHRRGLPPGEVTFAAIEQFSTLWKTIFHSVEKTEKKFPWRGKPARGTVPTWSIRKRPGRRGHEVENSAAAPEVRVRRGRGFSRRATEVCLSAAAVGGQDLVFRSWRAGDRMEPLGMRGSKKLSDIFTDLKVPRAERGRWMVVECGGKIAALAGWRVAREFAVESATAPSWRIGWKYPAGSAK